MQQHFPIGLDEDQNLLMGSINKLAPWPRLVENLGRTYVVYNKIAMKENMVGLFEECALYEEFIPSVEDVPYPTIESIVVDIPKAPVLDLDELLHVIAESSHEGARRARLKAAVEVQHSVVKSRREALIQYFEENNIPYKKAR